MKHGEIRKHHVLTLISYNINIEEIASKEYKQDETLPWEIVNYGVDKNWLLKEYQQAQDAISSIPCEVKCNNCGVCVNLKTKKVLAKN